MDIYKRVRELRKDHLHMSMAAFGGRLGVSRDVINNIEQNRLAKPDQKLSLIKLMCKEFHVNEDWLLNGNEPVFLQPDKFNLDDFMEERGATALETEIIKAYFGLEPTVRKDLFTHFKKCFEPRSTGIASIESAQTSTHVTPTPPDATARIEALERENEELRQHNQELDARLTALEQEDASQQTGSMSTWSSNTA